MSKHTPGPWLREGNTIYTLTHSGWRKGVEQLCNRFAAHVAAYHVDCQPEEMEANVQLMAAAPDLLEALKGFIDGAEAMGWYTDKARAAIAKATGETK